MCFSYAYVNKSLIHATEVRSQRLDKMYCNGFYSLLAEILKRSLYSNLHLSTVMEEAFVGPPVTYLFDVKIFISVKAPVISDKMNGIRCSFHGQGVL